jgi:hypothetical protein
MYVYVYVYVYMLMYVYVYIYMYIYMYTYIYIYIRYTHDALMYINRPFVFLQNPKINHCTFHAARPWAEVMTSKNAFERPLW